MLSLAYIRRTNSYFVKCNNYTQRYEYFFMKNTYVHVDIFNSNLFALKADIFQS